MVKGMDTFKKTADKDVICYPRYTVICPNMIMKFNAYE